MSKNNKIPEEEIRPVTQQEASNISNIFTQLSFGTQLIGNAIQRQALNNLGIEAMHKNKPVKTSVASLSSGLSSRLLYQGVAAYPSLCLRKYLTEDTNLPEYAITLATTGAETALGVKLDVKSSLKTLQSLGINIPKENLLNISARTFLPFYIRNGLAWCAINSNSQDNLASKALYGFGAGVLSTAPHNIGIKVMEHSFNKTIPETIKAVTNEISKDPQLLTRGSLLRGASILGTTLFFSREATQYLEDGLRNMFDSESDSHLNSKNPLSSPQKPSSTNVVSKNKEQER